MLEKIIKIIKKVFIFSKNVQKSKKSEEIRFCQNPKCENQLHGKITQKFCSESCKKKMKYKRHSQIQK